MPQLKWPIILITLAGSLLVLALALQQSMPSVEPLNGCLTAKMNTVWLCNKSENYVSLQDVSKYIVDAIVLTEDSSFFDHQGFDWYEIQKSLQKNVTSLKYARGASTITQQLAKNVFLSPEKSILRKLREAYLTTQLEKAFSKRMILEKYLNVIEFGPNVFGVKAAARYYFSKSPAEVSLVEAAFLAFVLPNPKEYQKSYANKDLTDFARKRLHQIVRTMFRFGRITAEERTAASELIGGTGWIEDKGSEENVAEESDQLDEPDPTDENQPIEPIENSEDSI